MIMWLYWNSNLFPDDTFSFLRKFKNCSYTNISMQRSEEFTICRLFKEIFNFLLNSSKLLILITLKNTVFWNQLCGHFFWFLQIPICINVATFSKTILPNVKKAEDEKIRANIYSQKASWPCSLALSYKVFVLLLLYTRLLDGRLASLGYKFCIYLIQYDAWCKSNQVMYNKNRIFFF